MSSRWTTRLRTLAVALILIAPLSSPAADNALTPTQMREDLKYLKDVWAPQDRSFSDIRRKAFERQVDEAAAGADGLTTEAFALAVMKALATARNGHTAANVGPLLGSDLPVRLWLFADGLHVVKAHPDFAHLLGARVDRIGSLSTEDALDRVGAYLSGTDQRIRFLAPGYLVTPSVLAAIGAIDAGNRVPLTVTLADGTATTVELAAASEDPGDERKANIRRGYAVLTPDDPALAGRWRHVLDGKDGLSPIYGKRMDVQSRFLDEGMKLLYIRSDVVRSTDDIPLSDKFAGLVFQHVLPNRPDNIIVDLRFNPGGDFFNTILFAQALPRLVPEKGKVFVLVGRATFSAALSTAAMLKGRGGDKVVLVGEEMGDSARFWAESKTLELPNSRIGVRYSPEFHDYATGCPELGDCYWALVAFGPRGISIAPEVNVDLAFRDYAEGRDPVLERVLDLVGLPRNLSTPTR